MSQSRMAELASKQTGAGIDVELSSFPQEPVASEVDNFLDEVNNVRSQMGTLRRLLDEIARGYDEQIWSSVQAGAAAPLHEQLQKTNTVANSIRNQLKKMGEENKGLSVNDQNARVRRNQLALLIKTFTEMMNEYKDLQENYATKYKDRVKRQAKIVSPAVTDQQVEEMMDHGQPDALFRGATLDHAEAKNALIFIQEQHRDVMELEKSIMALHQMFIDLAALVDAQQNMVDHIEVNVSSAVMQTTKALQKLEVAEQHVIAKRWKLFALAVILFIILLILLGAAGAGIALGVTQPWK